MPLVDPEIAQGSLIGGALMAAYYAWKIRVRKQRATAEAGATPQWRGAIEAERIQPFHETLPRCEGLLFVVGDELRFRPTAEGLLEEGVVAHLSAQNPDDLARGVVIGQKGASTIRLTLPPKARSLLLASARSFVDGGPEGDTI